MTRAPMIMPMIEPSPPARLVPPRMTATITSNSNPIPMLGSPTPRREAIRMPAKPANRLGQDVQAS